MKYHNILGELEFELEKFFVPHRVGCDGRYAILKHELWYVTDAYISIDGGWCEQVMPFDSWIQAVRFLKNHINELI